MMSPILLCSPNSFQNSTLHFRYKMALVLMGGGSEGKVFVVGGEQWNEKNVNDRVAKSPESKVPVAFVLTKQPVFYLSGFQTS